MSTILTFTLRHEPKKPNTGLTSKVNQVDLHYGDTVDLADLDNIPDDELVLVERQLFGKEAWYAVPAGIYKSNKHSMFGGNWIYNRQDFHLILQYQSMIE